MRDLTLFAHPDSGHSYKVALALELLDIHYRYDYVDISQAREARRRDFVRASPYGEVPLLLFSGGALAQSNAILLRIARDTRGLIEDEDLTIQWLFWEANRIGYSIPNLRFLLHFTPEPDPSLERMLRTRAEADLDRLDKALAASDFLTGAAVSIADIACSAYLFYGAQTGLELERWCNVARWLRRIAARPRWRAPYDLLDRSRATPIRCPDEEA